MGPLDLTVLGLPGHLHKWAMQSVSMTFRVTVLQSRQMTWRFMNLFWMPIICCLFLEHLKDSRYRDLNNDGIPDSGGDQWSADVFHTRDMVRQGVVADWMQMVRSLKACGEGTMLLDDGTEQLSCDWNDDGTIDIGGPDANFFILGGSLGGINSGVAAALMPEVTAFSPIAGGASLFDIALRTEIGGAVEAMHGRILSPMFLGYPNEDGSLRTGADGQL